MNEQQLAAVKLALEALELHAKQYPHMQKGYTVDAITALQSIISQDALDKMAENARELGLSYDDEPKIGCVNHDCDKCKAVQEPVAWLHPENATCVTTDPTAYARGTPLYAAPQPVPVKTYHDGKPWPVAPKPWVGLTADEMLEALTSVDPETQRLPVGFSLFAQAIETKLKEKNHG
jgi:hypothetical protein